LRIRFPSWRAVAAAGLALPLATCALNPATGQNEISLVSESQEIAMGREAVVAVAQQTPDYPDSGLQAYVNRVGQKLAAVGERPALPWQFRIVSDPSVNAFALPGGFIYITTGLMTDLESEAELASVLGHETGHVTARHSARQITRQELAQLGLVAGSLASSTFAQYAGALSQGLQLLFLSYSRADESQADALGFRYALKGGYDVRAMRDVFITLDGVTQAAGGARLPAWQSTHPAPADRITATDQRLAAAKVNYDSLYLGRSQYLHRIDGMVYGDDPRHGYFDGARFLHPDLRFQFTFPSGWKTFNVAASVSGESQAQDAIVQITLAQGSPDSAARALFSQQGVQSANVGATRINGLAAVSGDFSAQGQNTTIRGRASFVSWGNRTYALVGYTTTDRWSSYQGAISAALQSFRPLTDPQALAVQPMHLRIETLSKPMTLAQFYRMAPTGVPLAELCLVNRVDSTQVLPAGTIVKRILK
jgi:predicted Zn-dependent protease